jgi:polar amino acid transport system permease protein
MSEREILPVIHRIGPALRRRGLPVTRLRLWHVLFPLWLILAGATAHAASDPAAPGIFTILARWSPLLLRGFVFNIVISLLSMLLGTALGLWLGLALVSQHSAIRMPALATTEFFRNAPWLVLLFFVTFMLPFQLDVGHFAIPFPGWIKAVLGLALAIMANVAEIVRGAVQSIHPGQWEASEALGFTRGQQMWRIILPQCIKRMIPPWMNLYAIVTMSTTLASIIGVNEVVTLAGQVQAAEGGRPDLLAPIYGYVLLLFFIYSYPISVWTRRLERKYATR